MKSKILLIIASLIISVVLCEIGLHLLVQPSPRSYGVLFEKELPPLKVLSREEIRLLKDSELKDEWYNGIIVDGKKITMSDISGRMREDELLGYTVLEDFASTNRWYVSNNIGARSDTPTSAEKPPGRERLLFFGDSFTQGESVRQGDDFVSMLNIRNSNIEAVNLAVSGYSTGQSYLRFKTLKNKLEYDSVFLVIVPSSDLWRDTNVSRYIADGWQGWGLKILPRFIISNGELRLIPSPYKNLRETVDDNLDSISDKLRDHLEKYDPFYFGFMFENSSILDHLIIVKLLKRKYYDRERDKIWRSKNLKLPDSEAMRVTKRIIKEMAHETKLEGKEFYLIVLPEIWEIKQYSSESQFKKSWDEMAMYLCAGDYICYDLMQDFQQAPIEHLDHTYDGGHNGPNTNRLIADFILKKLSVN